VTERGIMALVDYPGALILLPTMFWGLSLGAKRAAHTALGECGVVCLHPHWPSPAVFTRLPLLKPTAAYL
jgi:hypothetical protein